MLAAYLDESDGGNRTEGHFCVAGYLADRNTWKTFSDAWDSVLNTKPSIPYYKTTEFRTRVWRAEYGLSEEQEETRYRHLIELIRDNEDILFSVCVNVDQPSYCRLVKNVPPVSRLLNEPYQFGFHRFVATAIHTLREKGITDNRVDFIMDKATATTDRAAEIFKGIRAVADPWFADLMGNAIARDDKETPALQAADMLASAFKDHCYKQVDVPYIKKLHDLCWDKQQRNFTHRVGRSELEEFMKSPSIQAALNRPKKERRIS